MALNNFEFFRYVWEGIERSARDARLTRPSRQTNRSSSSSNFESID
jgi:hypothetical protein